MRDYRIIAVDFDGTLVANPVNFPEPGKQRWVHKLVLCWLKRRQRKGDKVIIWTLRKNSHLFPAQRWAKSVGFIPDGWNDESHLDLNGWTLSRKLAYDLIIDDRQVGFVGWLLRLFA